MINTIDLVNTIEIQNGPKEFVICGPCKNLREGKLIFTPNDDGPKLIHNVKNENGKWVAYFSHQKIK